MKLKVKLLNIFLAVVLFTKLSVFIGSENFKNILMNRFFNGYENNSDINDLNFNIAKVTY